MIVGYRTGLLYHAPEASVASIHGVLAARGFTSGERYVVFETGDDTLVLLLTLI